MSCLNHFRKLFILVAVALAVLGDLSDHPQDFSNPAHSILSGLPWKLSASSSCCVGSFLAATTQRDVWRSVRRASERRSHLTRLHVRGLGKRRTFSIGVPSVFFFGDSIMFILACWNHLRQRFLVILQVCSTF